MSLFSGELFFFLGAVIDSVFWVDVRFLSAFKVLHCSGVVVM